MQAVYGPSTTDPWPTTLELFSLAGAGREPQVRNGRCGAGKRCLRPSDFLIHEIPEDPQRLGHLVADYPQLRPRDVSVSFCQRQNCLKDLI